MTKELKSSFRYYVWATYRRKLLDKLLEENKHYYKGIVLDVGGRRRGKFKRPEVGKWIFADIEKNHTPDILLDVADMSEIKSESIDVVNAIELFEHVEKIEQGLKECHRVLKKNGRIVISVPFLYPIHADPGDYQRWTKKKWKKNLEKIGFKIEKFENMGRYFTVLAEMIKILIKSITPILKYPGYAFYPFLDLMVSIDKFSFVKNNNGLNKYTTGYFIIAKK